MLNLLLFINPASRETNILRSVAPHQSHQPSACWTPPAMGWAEMVQAWQSVSSQTCAKGLMWQEVTGQRYWTVPAGRQPS